MRLVGNARVIPSFKLTMRVCTVSAMIVIPNNLLPGVSFSCILSQFHNQMAQVNKTPI